MERALLQLEPLGESQPVSLSNVGLWQSQHFTMGLARRWPNVLSHRPGEYETTDVRHDKSPGSKQTASSGDDMST